MSFRSDLVAASVFGLIVGAIVVMTVEGLSREPARPESPSPQVVAKDGVRHIKSAPASAHVALAWSPGGLPGEAASAVAATDAVDRVVEVVAGMDWIPAQRPGYEIPFELAAVEPAYGDLAPRGEASAFRGMGKRDIVLAATSATSLKLDAGDELRLRSGRYTIAGIVSDVTAMGYEGLIANVPPTWTRRDLYLIAEIAHGSSEDAVASIRAALRTVLPDHIRVRVRAEGETPYLRYGDAVAPLLVIKKNFGTFSLRRTAAGHFSVDPGWRRNVVARKVPLLGRVRCHRSLIAQLRGALRELAAEGLGHTVNPGDYGGCWSPRFIGRDPGGQLSHHAWGIAIDLNASANAFGTKSDQDDRLVETMERWGFTWGGRWLVPDAMHFEWARFPDPVEE